jgi:NTE family protein
VRVTVRSLLLLAAAVLLAACAGQPINTKLGAFDGTSGTGTAIIRRGNADDLLVILAFSGGGTRAAAFSFGVMEGLNDTKYRGPKGKRALLEDVDVISSVSGGSFTAAYYGLFRKEFFKEFPGAFLHRDIEGDLLLRALSPVNWVRLASPSFDRIDMAAELYDEVIFKGAIRGSAQATAEAFHHSQCHRHDPGAPLRVHAGSVRSAVLGPRICESGERRCRFLRLPGSAQSPHAREFRGGRLRL